MVLLYALSEMVVDGASCNVKLLLDAEPVLKSRMTGVADGMPVGRDTANMLAPAVKSAKPDGSIRFCDVPLKVIVGLPKIASLVKVG